MTNLKAIIVDEERLARVNLKRLLIPYPEIEIAGEASSCAGALEMISLHDPQLIFLDLQLRGETGFDLIGLIDKAIKVIFVSAYDDNAARTFEMNAVDFLAKPVNPELLKDAIGKVKRT
jgi:two-component system LytT family response regulator